MKKKKESAADKLKKSPINYFSDLFIVAMVTGWVAVLLIMTGMAIYATLSYADTYIWSEVRSLVSGPLEAGGAIWMIKNGVQHAIASYQGRQAHMDFPAVNADGEDNGIEQAVNVNKSKKESEGELG